jgi:site-specific DNA-methyltransferase (adenine-specific)
MSFLVEHLSDVAEIVLDPFAGIGTTCVAAVKLGRHFIGAEKHPEYAELARWQVERAAAAKK